MVEKSWDVVPPEGPPGKDVPPAPSGSGARLATAFAVAVGSDLLSVWLAFAPPLQWTLDITTAVVLFVILGRQWLILPALMAEAIPGLAVLPAWVLVVASIAAWGTVNPLGGRSRS